MALAGWFVGRSAESVDGAGLFPGECFSDFFIAAPRECVTFRSFSVVIENAAHGHVFMADASKFWRTLGPWRRRNSECTFIISNENVKDIDWLLTNAIYLATGEGRTVEGGRMKAEG